jgi:hypothetical protein
MAIQFGVDVQNARLDAIETSLGTGAKLRIYTGSAPATPATAASGTMLVELTLPSDWMNAASSGTKTKLGTWSGTAAAGGTAGYFRIWNSAVSVCGVQGTVGQGSGDLSLDNTSIANGQTVTINTFTFDEGND